MDTIKVLHIKLEKEFYCIPLEYIEKIILLPALQPIPNSPNYIMGIVNLSGKSVTVIDLALRLNIERKTPYTLETSIIICKYKNQYMGLIIDTVEELSELSKNDIQMEKEFEHTQSLFLGSIKYKNHLSLLININYIFSISLSEYA